MALGKKIAFLGTGNMAEALVKGLLRAGAADPAELVCAEPREDRRREISQRYGVRCVASNGEAVEGADVVLLSVKPQVIDAVLEEIAAEVRDAKLVISIAAGVPIASLARKLPAGARIVRTMPNTPALVGAGAAALSGGSHATPDDLALARRLLESVGTAAVVAEPLLDAVTGLSGSGPAFVYLFIEALADGGVKAGLPRAEALSLAAQTVLGAARMVLESGEHPGRLKDQVTSPGGTTIAGVHALEKAGFRGAVMDAVEAAARRSRELGERK
jgi:pyrroline-5-carboxylate reductase